MNTSTIRITKPEEVLCLVPHALGYRPSRHFVILAFDADGMGRSHGIGPAMSFDISEMGIGPELAEAAAEACAMLDAPILTLALYVESLGEFLDEGPLPAFVDVLEYVAHALEGREDAHVAAFLADAEHWVRIDSPVFAPRPWSVLDAQAERVAAVLGEDAPTCEASGLELPAHSEAFAARVRACAEAHREAGTEGSRQKAAIRAWRLLAQAVQEQPDLDWIEEDPELVGQALAGLDEGNVRDRLFLHACGSKTKPLQGSMSDARIEKGLEEVWSLMPASGRVLPLIRFLEHMAACAGPHNPHPLSVCAYLAWWIGRNSLAHMRACQALEADEENLLANLVASVVESGRTPPWMDKAMMRSSAA